MLPKRTKTEYEKALLKYIEEQHVRKNLSRARRLKPVPKEWVERHHLRCSQLTEHREPFDTRRLMSVAAQKRLALKGKKTYSKHPLLYPKKQAKYHQPIPGAIYDPLSELAPGKFRVYGKGDLTLRDWTKMPPVQSHHGLPIYGEDDVPEMMDGNMHSGPAPYGYNAQPDN